MASYNGSHVPKLSHLWQLAVRAQSAIGEVAQAAADAVSAVADAKAESRAGVLRLRAQRAPTAAISASYYIIR